VASHSERVLVTGARGFTGRYLRRELEGHGYDVVGLVNEAPTAANEVFADLRDPAAVATVVRDVAPDHVIHLAAIAFVAAEDPEPFYRVNLLGSLALLRAIAAADNPVRRVILASSANVYGNVEADLLDETTPTVPANHYAVSKRAMEDMAALFRPVLPIVIARPFNYTGPGQSVQYLVPKIVDHFRRRAPVIELGNVDVIRDFLDVRTVVEVYRRLLAAPAAAGATVNICSGRGLALRDVIGLLGQATGHAIRIQVNPRFVRAQDVRRLVGSNRRLRELIGETAAMPFEGTLRDMLAVGDGLDTDRARLGEQRRE
jgi:GDP-6-deoxy-D-talose 4-dehydrogenase